MLKFLLLLLVPVLGAAQSEAGTEFVTLENALKNLPGSNGQPFTMPMKKGNMRVLLYQPKEIDKQDAHADDEVYVIVSGIGKFSDGEKEVPFKPHDVIYVKAGQEHRFVDFSDDFLTWVIFY